MLDARGRPATVTPRATSRRPTYRTDLPHRPAAPACRTDLPLTPSTRSAAPAAGPEAWAQPRLNTVWSSQDGTVGIDTPEGGHHFSFENSNPDQSAMWEDNGTVIQQSPLGADSWTDTTGRTVKYIVMPSGKPVAYTIGGIWNSLLTDKQGSVRVITTESGGIAAQYTYDPYGGFRNVWEYTDEAHANKIQYAGAYLQNGLGIYRMGVRWYDPGLGRFTNPDPSTKEANPYLYAAGNPCNNTDPTGKSCSARDGAILGVIGGVAAAAYIGSGAVIGGTIFAGASAATLEGAAIVSTISGHVGYAITAVGVGCGLDELF